MDVTLEKWTMGFSEDIVSAFVSKKLIDKLPESVPYPFEKKHARYYIEQRMFNNEEQQYCRAIIADGKAVGGIDVFLGRGQYSKSAELTFWLSEPYQDTDIGKSAIKKACADIFELYSVVRIFARPYADDDVSSRLLEAADFCFEGHIRKSIRRDMKLYDQNIYSILRDE